MAIALISCSSFRCVSQDAEARPKAKQLVQRLTQIEMDLRAQLKEAHSHLQEQQQQQRQQQQQLGLRQQQQLELKSAQHQALVSSSPQSQPQQQQQNCSPFQQQQQQQNGSPFQQQQQQQEQHTIKYQVPESYTVLSCTVRTVRYGTVHTVRELQIVSKFLKPFMHASFKNAAQNNLKLRIVYPSL